MKLGINRSSVALLLLFAWLLLLAGEGAPLLAHPEGPAHGHIPPHATDVMRAFQKDQQPVQALPAASEVACVDGFAGPYPCHKVDLLSFLPLSDIGGGRGNDIWGWTDPLTGKEYALMGRSTGTSFVDISDPANPLYLGDLPTSSLFSSSWRDIKVYANHAFIVSEAQQHGMQVFDLTQLRGVTSPPVTFSESAHYSGIRTAHNIAINEASGYAYIVGSDDCNGGLHMVDIQSPTSPTFAGCFSTDGYTHDTQCVIYAGPDSEFQGREICFNANEDTLTIVDVTNKSAPATLSRTGYTGSGYVHQGWLTEDQRYFLLDDEGDERNNGHNTRTYIWDLSSLRAPQLTGSFTASTPAIDHNLYIKGNYAYQANYRAGLRILDITGIADASLIPVGYFDIYPEDDAAEFNGAWSNYPFFASGVVVVSGIEQGLFVLRPHELLSPEPTPEPTPEPGRIHVGDLDGSSQWARGKKWEATVTVTVHDESHAAVGGAVVEGSWGGGASGSGSCTTQADGTCSVTKGNISGNAPSVTFTITAIGHSSYSYDGAANHDPDGESDGTTITVSQP